MLGTGMPSRRSRTIIEYILECISADARAGSATLLETPLVGLASVRM